MSSQEPGKFQLFFWGGAEDGSAYYSQHLAVEYWYALEPAKCKLATAIDKIPFSAKSGRPFTFADYGCRDGGISVSLIKHLIECLRQKQDPMPDVLVMYEDQPYGDFKSLFLMANGLTGAEYESAWSSQDGVYFSAVGRSFYEQCFPRNSVQVGFSSYAVMYLSTRPCLFPDVLLYTLSTDDKKKALMAKQAASDWETFLLHRCRELTPGGLLFVVCLYMTEDGHCEGAPKEGKNLYEVMHTIWEQLYQEGRITKDELQKPTFNLYIRTVEEFKAPLLNKNSSIYREGLRMVSLETELMDCPCQEELLEDGDVNDPEFVAQLAHKFVSHSRPWTSGDFLAALSSRPETERREIVDELFLRIEAQFRAEPTTFNQDAPTAYIMMRKISE